MISHKMPVLELSAIDLMRQIPGEIWATENIKISNMYHGVHIRTYHWSVVAEKKPIKRITLEEGIQEFGHHPIINE